MSGTSLGSGRGLGVTLPSLCWLGLFFVVPTILIFLVAFRPADPLGGVGDGWTLDAWVNLWQPYYGEVLWRTIRLSVLTTIITLALALPAAAWIARLPARWKPVFLLLIILPFWSNFLIRIFAWKSLLHPGGVVHKFAVWLGVIEPSQLLLYNETAILVVLVYTSLPFALLPLYAAAEKFDFSLLEAARDLGCSAWGAWTKVFLPGISRGIVVAVLLVWIPAVGAFAVPDIVGGFNNEMWGNQIARRVFTDRNLPQASALASFLAVLVIVPLGVWGMLVLRRERRSA